MSSRERTLAAIAHEQPDRVPVFFRQVAPLHPLWRDRHERIDVLRKMGVDEKVTLHVAPRVHPDVTIRDGFDEDGDRRYRLAWREYRTPKGTIRTVMRCTEDCRYENGVPLTSDHNISRAVEFPVKGREDLPKLAYLLQPPDAEDIARFREQAQREKAFAADRGVVVEGCGGPGGDLAFYLCGPDLFYLVQDDPGFGEELLEMAYGIDLKCMELLLAEGVDFLDARGCYETAPMWSPALYDKLFAPGLARKAALAHQAGARLSYFSTGDFAAEVDIITCTSPFPGGVNDMRTLKDRLGHRICLWGGINPEQDIEKGSPQDVRRAVIDVLDAAAAGGGLVLSTGGSILGEHCYDNVMAFIEAAREFGRYPIDTARLASERERTLRESGKVP